MVNSGTRVSQALENLAVFLGSGEGDIQDEKRSLKGQELVPAVESVFSLMTRDKPSLLCKVLHDLRNSMPLCFMQASRDIPSCHPELNESLWVREAGASLCSQVLLLQMLLLSL